MNKLKLREVGGYRQLFIDTQGSERAIEVKLTARGWWILREWPSRAIISKHDSRDYAIKKARRCFRAYSEALRRVS